MLNSRTVFVALAMLLAGCPTRGGRGGSSDGNASPSEPVIEIQPGAPVNADDLTLVIVTESVDPDDEGITYDIEWTVDGEPVTDLEDPMLVPAELTSPEQTWQVTVWGNDGEEISDPVTASVLVTNTPPTTPGISISPAAPGDFDDLLLVYSTESTDAEGDPITYVVEWTVNGSAVTDLADPNVVPSARTSLDESWAVTVRADDGLDQSDPASDSVLVDNAAPTVSGVSLTTGAVFTDDTLTVSPSSSDSEGDPVSLAYEWFVNGSALGGNSPSLNGLDWFDKDDEVYVIVTPSDPFGVGEPVQSNSVTVLNSVPEAPVVSLTPSSPVELEDDLVCELSSPAFDLDGDAITYTFAWEYDGNPFNAIGTTFLPGDTVAAGLTIEDEVWTCTVTPNDGDADGPDGGDSVTVQGPAPDLIVDGFVLNLGPGTYIYDDVFVINGGLLLIEGLVVIDANSFEVDGASTLQGSGAGGAGGNGSSAGSGPGAGGTSSDSGAGGGGYGGGGGDGGFDSGDSPGSGGSSYGNASTLSIEAGSGGGGASGLPGGDGGAALWLTAGEIVVAGSITMSGATPSGTCSATCPGGGSGGGILLRGDDVTLTGLLSVSGGDGSPGTSSVNDSGGGGGGGRIKVFYDANLSDTSVFDVSGGLGGPYGSADGGDDGLTGTGVTQFMPF